MTARRRILRKPDQTKRVGAIWDALAQGDPGAPALQDDVLNRREPPRARQQQLERDQVQRPLIVYLRRHLPEGSVVFAPVNMARSREQLFSLMRDGMLPGIPDICICTTRTLVDDNVEPWTRPWVGFIECKRPDGGTLSDNQIEIQAQLVALGFPVLSECRAVHEAHAWLGEQGVKMR